MHNGRRAKKDKPGYIYLWEPTHPSKSYSGWQPEHRLVAEAQVKRFLTRDEQVHHINGIKDDNRPENLQVLTSLEHINITVQETLKKRKSIEAELAEYKKRFGHLT